VRGGYALRRLRGIIRSLELVGGSVPNHQGGSAMPVYEYHCDKCAREVTLTLSIREHEKGEIKCPKCGGESLRPLLSAFMSQTAKKS
jgi:putative FmdB family regulatory protein